MNQKINFVKLEEDILKIWTKEKAFDRSNVLSKDKPEYVFYDGPPFATGLPHYGHILSGTMKDVVTRFYYMLGFKVERNFGWDCHGLPVEYEIDKMLGIKSNEDVISMGITNYNKECRNIVLRYTKEWESIVERMGRWIDFKNGYRTMDASFMESVWSVFKMLYDKRYIYKGYKVMPYSTACSTPLSNFEATQNYKDVTDPSILIAFPLLEEFKGYKISLIAWTTTPWTLTSNLSIIVNRNFYYSIFKTKNSFFMMHKDRLKSYFKDAVLIQDILGEELLGLHYLQPFKYFEHYRSKGFFKVYHGEFVSETDGTGIVHSAPGFGEEDYKCMVDNGLIKENELVPSPLDEKGRFTADIPDYMGIYFKDVDKIIIKDLKDKIIWKSSCIHRYPFCWRSDTPLVYKLVSNWFIRVKDEISNLVATNEEINWVPSSIKHSKFRNWLLNARDWAISRNRFWGTPIPIWRSDDNDYICIGSIEELEKESGIKLKDLHRENVDEIAIKRNGKTYKRIHEVFDCWFESGSMPYAQRHWPFSKDLKLPADFIAEGSDQTRGWFYTLHVISTILFRKPAFKNCIVNGIVLANDKKKMSKRLKNYPDPMDIVKNYGADSLRLYLISGPVVMGESMCFSEKGVSDVLKNLIVPWYNCLAFYKECSNSGGETEMDEWILNSLNTAGFSIKSDLKKYTLSNVMNHGLNFINNLSNWYIRMNRRSLKEGSSQTLKIVLTKFSIVMAPFVPFFSEYSYQLLSQSKDFSSVHYQSFPVFHNIRQHNFDRIKKIIEGIRKMRDLKGISLKTPLKQAQIISEKSLHPIILKYSNIIRNECFLLNLKCLDESLTNFKTSFVPNFSSIKNLGDKEQIKTKINVIRNLPSDQLRDLFFNNLNLTVKDISIHKEDVICKKELICAEDYYLSFEDFSIILDTNITCELDEMKVAREFFRCIQELRKKTGFKATDVVSIYSSSHKINLIAKKYYKDIQFIEDKCKGYAGKGYFKYEDSNIEIYIYKLLDV